MPIGPYGLPVDGGERGIGNKMSDQTVKTAPKNNIQEGKLRMHFLPLDLLAEILCPAYEEGVLKYREESWREGFKTSVIADAALRHISAFVNKGEDYDAEAFDKFGIKKTHIGGAIFSLICMYQTMRDYPQLDDRPAKRNIKGEEYEFWKKAGEAIHSSEDKK